MNMHLTKVQSFLHLKYFENLWAEQSLKVHDEHNFKIAKAGIYVSNWVWDEVGDWVIQDESGSRCSLYNWGFVLSLSSCNSNSQVVLVVKNLPANVGDSGDVGLIPGSGRYPGGRNGNSLQYSCLEIPWREEPGGLQSIGSERIGHDWANIHKCSKQAKTEKALIHVHLHTHTHLDMYVFMIVWAWRKV